MSLAWTGVYCSVSSMKTIPEKLETLFDKVRALLEERQQAAAEALSEIASETYTLSEDELGALRPALQRAQRGEYADETAISGDRRPPSGRHGASVRPTSG